MSAVLRSAMPRLSPMTERDLDAVLAIESDIYAFPWTRGNFLDSLAAGYSCWLFADGADLIGYAVIMHAVDEAHLLNLSIARSAQRRGHGTRLLADVEATARGHGAVSLVLEVRPSNAAGRALYNAAGYRQIGTRRGYYPAMIGREDAFVLSRTL